MLYWALKKVVRLIVWHYHHMHIFRFFPSPKGLVSLSLSSSECIHIQFSTFSKYISFIFFGRKKNITNFAYGKPLWNNGRYGRPFLRGFLFYNSVELFKAFFVYFDFDFPFRSFVRKFVTVVAYNFAFLLSLEILPVFHAT